MSKVIDERVVEMRFDNKQFEKNTKETMSTLDKLKEKLKFNGATKGLEEVGKATKNVNMSGIGSAVDAVKIKFSALEVMGITALTNIANSAVNAGKRMINSLTIDPVKTGFQEYELKMGSIQTIMAGTGESLEVVNRYLDELNTYADKTIYSFSDMTSNIGKFTNAGVKLKDAVKAIQGVSNEAAISGANATQASAAMYNFAQALSAGYVKLIDWKSIENANMATLEFKNQLLETAVSLGTVTKSADGMYTTLSGKTFNATRDFNDCLQEQWMTTDVLVTTLGKYADETTEIGKKAFAAAQDVKTFTQLMDTLKEAAGSGWAETWQLIIGDFNEAKQLWTNVSEVLGGIIQKSADARNALLKGALTSNWEQLSEKVKNAGVDVNEFQQRLIDTAKSHGIAVDEMISKSGSFEKSLKNGWLTKDIIVETLSSFVKGADEVSKSTEDMSEKLKYFQDVVDKVWHGSFYNGEERIKALTEAGYNYAEVQELVDKTVDGHRLTLEDLNETELKNIGYTDEQISKIKELAKEAKKTGTPLNDLIDDMSRPSGRELLIESFSNAAKALGVILTAAKDAWRDVFPATTSKQLYSIISGLNEFSKWLNMGNKNANKLKRTLKGLFSILHIISTLANGVMGIGLRLLCNIFGIMGDDILTVTATLGDMIVAFDKWLFQDNIVIKSIEKLIGHLLNLNVYLGKGIDKVGDWIDTFKEIPIVKKTIEDLGIAIDETMKSIKEYFDGGKEAISDFKKEMSSMDGISLNNIGDVAGKFKEKVLDYFLDMSKPADTAKKSFSGFTDALSENFDSAGGSLKDFKDNVTGSLDFIKDRFSGINIGSILAIGLGGGAIKVLMNFGTVLQKFSGLLDGSIGIFASFNKVLKGFTTKLKAEAMFSIAKALAILVASLILLAQVDQDRLWSSVKIMGALAAGLTALTFAAGYGGNIKDFGKVSVLVLAISAALMIMATALKKIDSIKPGKLMADVTALIVMMGSLVAMAGIFGHSKGNFDKGATVILAMAISLKIMISAVKSIGELNPETLGSSIISVCVLLLALGSACAILGKNGKVGSDFGKGAKTILAVAIALKVIVSAIRSLGEMDGETAIKGIFIMSIVFVEFIALIAITKLAGQWASKAGGAILAISVSLIIISAAIKLLARLTIEEVGKSLAITSAIMVLFGAIVAVSKFAGEHAAKAGIMLLAMSASILILAGVIMLLSILDPSSLIAPTACIVALGAMFALLIKVTEHSKDQTKMITQMAVTLGVLAIALATLAMINKSQLATTTVALSSVMGMFALMIGITKYSKNTKQTMRTLAGMSGVILVISGILYSLSILKPKNVLKIATALSELLLSLAISIGIIGTIGKGATTSLATLGVMTLIVAGLAVIVGIMGQFKMDNILEKTTALSQLLLAMSACCLILIPVGATGPAAFIGIGALLTLMTSIGALMLAVGALVDTFPDAEKFLDKGIDILCEIGYGMGKFVGSLAGGVMDGITSGLPSVGTSLSQFAKNATPFFETMKSLDGNVFNNAKSLAEMLLILTATNILDGIGSFLVGDLNFEGFGTKLKDLGKGIVEFSKVVSSGSFNADIVSSASTAGKILAEIAGMTPRVGGVLQDLIGTKDLGKFASTLKPFAKGIVSFSNEITANGGINGEAVEVATNAGKLMIELAKAVPATGGILQALTGEVKIDEFAGKLGAFADGIIAFSTKVSKKGAINSSAVEAATNAGKLITSLAESIPKTDGGLAGIFVGNKTDIEDFGAKLVAFGNSMISYSNSIKGMNIELIESSAKAGKALVSVAKSASSDKVNVSLLDTLGTSMVSFGQNLAVYSATVSFVNTEKMFKINEIIGKLTTAIQSTSGLDTGKLKDVAVSLKDISSFIGAFDTKMDIASVIQGIFNSVVRSAELSKNEMSNAFSEAITASITTINARKPLFILAGTGCVQAFANGIKLKKKTISTAFTSGLTSSISSIKGYYLQFYQAGSYLVDGFAAGIRSNSYKGSLAASAMAQAAVNAAKRTLDINSPSKVFEGIGNYSGLGFVNALKDYVSIAKSAGSDMAQGSIDGLKDTLSNTNNVINLDSDMNPTIRPVLDLSNIQRGSSMINDLFTQRTIALATSATLVTSNNSDMMNAINEAVKSTVESLLGTDDTSSDDKVVAEINLQVDLDGKEIAKVTAPFTNKELNKINNRNSRKGGKL